MGDPVEYDWVKVGLRVQGEKSWRGLVAKTAARLMVGIENTSSIPRAKVTSRLKHYYKSVKGQNKSHRPRKTVRRVDIVVSEIIRITARALTPDFPGNGVVIK